MNYDRPANLSSQLLQSFHWKPNCRKILIFVRRINLAVNEVLFLIHSIALYTRRLAPHVQDKTKGKTKRKKGRMFCVPNDL